MSFPQNERWNPLVSFGTWVGVCCGLGLIVTMEEILHDKMIMMEEMPKSVSCYCSRYLSLFSPVGNMTGSSPSPPSLSLTIAKSQASLEQSLIVIQLPKHLTPYGQTSLCPVRGFDRHLVYLHTFCKGKDLSKFPYVLHHGWEMKSLSSFDLRLTIRLFREGLITEHIR
ncbi:hypothetical protein STEG23_034229, partial [Scotinomys teguina]